MPENSSLQMCWRSGLKRPPSLSSCISFLLEQPPCFAAPDKGVNCPQNTSPSQQSFCVSSVTIKIPFSNPAQLFSPPLQKKESFSDAKGRDQWGPGLMVTKRPEGWPSFQHHGLWVFQAMDKHYGLSAVKMVNLIKEVTPQHLSVFLRITPDLLESLRQPTGIPRVSWSCCFVPAQRQWHPRQCCGPGIPIWILLIECFRQEITPSWAERLTCLVCPGFGVLSGFLLENFLIVGAERGAPTRGSLRGSPLNKDAFLVEFPGYAMFSSCLVNGTDFTAFKMSLLPSA